MKLLDEGLPRSTVALARSLGFECDHVADVGLAGHADTEIIELARKNKSIIVTLDADSHALIATSGRSSPTVIRIRTEGMKGPEIAVLLNDVAAVHGQALESGALLTITASRTSLHNLPVQK